MERFCRCQIDLTAKKFLKVLFQRDMIQKAATFFVFSKEINVAVIGFIAARCGTEKSNLNYTVIFGQ